MMRSRALCLLLSTTTLSAFAPGAQLRREGRATRVINLGVPGENSAEIRARFRHSLLSVRPTYVLLDAGMNDAVNDRKFLPVQESIQNIEEMLADARRLGAEPVLITVHHVDAARVLARHDAKVYGAAGPNGRVDQVDEGLLQMASAQHVRVADFRSALDRAGGPTTELSTDGVHLSRAGYGLLAKAARAALPRHLPGGTTVLCIGDSLTYGIGVRPAGSVDGTGARQRYPTYPEQLAEMLSSTHKDR